MKIAKKDSAPPLNTDEDKLENLYVVNDDYDFVGNSTTDATTLEYIKFLYGYHRMDYKNFRSMLAIAVATTGFENLSEDDKRLAALYFATTGANIASVFPNIQDRINNGKLFHESSIESRSDRAKFGVAEVYNRLSTADMQLVINAITTDNLLFNYTELGREGTESGDGEGIYDYLNAVSGTSYESTGLAAQSYTVTDMVDCAELGTKITNILKGVIE